MSVTWVLVADRARARLFSLDPEAKALEEVEDFVNTEGRTRARELQSDRPQTSHDRFGDGRHAIEPHTSAEEKSAARFAGQLDRMLELGRTGHRYRDLVLIAPPRFLGTLNAALGAQVRACVVSEVAKEMTQADAHAVFAELPKSVLRRGEIITGR